MIREKNHSELCRIKLNWVTLPLTTNVIMGHNELINETIKNTIRSFYPREALIYQSLFILNLVLCLTNG